MTLSDQIKEREERKKKESAEFHRRIGDNLRKLREARNYTQEYLADVLRKKNYSSYGKLESGHLRLSIEDAIILSDLYDISIEGLLNPGYKRKEADLSVSDDVQVYNRQVVELMVKLDGTEVSLVKQIDLLKNINKVLAEG
jgi:transcriptional regulator with XRE-family HTH domain